MTSVYIPMFQIVVNLQIAVFKVRTITATNSKGMKYYEIKILSSHTAYLQYFTFNT